MGPVTDHVMEETPAVETPAPSFGTPMESAAPTFTPTTMPEVTETPVAPTMDAQFNVPSETPTFPSFSASAPEVAPAMPDLQQFVNNQVAEVPPMATPAMETPTPVAAPVETPMPDFNQAPATTDTATPTQTGTSFSI
jgi:hypothetical protein